MLQSNPRPSHFKTKVGSSGMMSQKSWQINRVESIYTMAVRPLQLHNPGHVMTKHTVIAQIGIYLNLTKIWEVMNLRYVIKGSQYSDASLLSDHVGKYE
jgi:hypothetical protein